MVAHTQSFAHKQTLMQTHVHTHTDKPIGLMGRKVCTISLLAAHTESLESFSFPSFGFVKHWKPSG